MIWGKERLKKIKTCYSMTSLEVKFDKYDYGKHSNFRLLKDKSTYQKARQTAVRVYNRGYRHGQ